MTDAAIIQILSRFAAHQVCPSLGNTWPCCPLPAWLRVTAPWDRWSCKEAGGQQGRWPTPLHTQLLSPEPVFRPCSSVATAAQRLTAHPPACTQMQPHQPGLTSEENQACHTPQQHILPCPAAVKHKVSKSSPPIALALHNLSGSTSQTPSTTSNCTCHCPTQHQVLPGSPPQGSEPNSPGAAFSPPQDHISSTFKHTTHTHTPTIRASISTSAATPVPMLEKSCLFQASAS